MGWTYHFKIIFLPTIGLLIFGIIPNLFAQVSTSDDQNKGPTVLSLQEAIRQALENDIGIQVERQTPRIRSHDITVEKGNFDPTLNATITNSFSLNPRPVSVIEGAFLTSEVESAQIDYGLGLEQKLTTGTDYKLKWNNTRSRGSLQSFNPSFQSNVTLDLTQPLLNGFGLTVNRSQVLIAQNNFSISREAFSAKVMDLVRDVQNLYWDLAFQRENLKVSQQFLRAAQDLFEINKAKVQQGLLAPVEVLVAEAEVAAREEGVLLAEKDLRDAEDRLRRVIQPIDLIEEIPIIPTDEPVQKPYHPDSRETLQTALEHRPDLKQARINLKNRKISLQVAENQVLPTLNLQAGAGLNGLGDTYGNDMDQLTSTDFYSWQAGVAFSTPIGNRAARGNLARQRVNLEKTQMDLKNLEQEVILEVKEAIRRVQTDEKRIESNQKARFLAGKKLEVETERYNLGLTTTHDVLEFQKDLANARVNELKAILDYNRSLVNLDRVKGTILTTHNIVVKE
jgi:outer membrane protein TolC